MKANRLRCVILFLLLGAGAVPLSAQQVEADRRMIETKAKAEQGEATAQCDLGLCYCNGDGVAKDFVQALKWLRKSADQDNAKAQYNLGVCYERGEGVDKDLVEAVKWYRKAAERGNAKAQSNLSV